MKEILAKYSTFGIGGPADYFIKATTTNDLIKATHKAKYEQIPFIIIGKGSNILFDDKGFRGLIILNETSEITLNKNNHTIKADSGVTITTLLSEIQNNNYSGLEKWTGLPGTVGGAVFGNAGCNGLETADILIEAEVYDPDEDTIKNLQTQDLNFSYRHSNLKNTENIILSATFQLQNHPIDPDKLKQIKKDLATWRAKTQPFGASSGSFFANPNPENPAGKLIDEAGLKGKTIGSAQISEKHGNFLLNKGKATFADMIKLAKLAQKTVKDKFKIDLEEEVQIITETGKTKLKSL